MSEKRPVPPRRDSDREARLKAALKANLARRKQQARARDAAAKDTDKGATGSDKD